ncbi:ImmA/IrrE family metallo-endopeptidase [Liquorilactobacillus capillatus]|uniref:IrrE N-terminal-like domain-containing protein n=1 Tax=Liquorilactobacillus capillatus DSM 19910 TaxID=1423731 RepID=A0A0R1M0H5_9LACO|nr:ImmA/IrrE family metallo-endopeptidase [Liquorilactobacillus capillatus]KRL01431.1 hypothetical protein FC81_GL001577 [Liquorilactobacillus capillatus DSM 19910]
MDEIILESLLQKAQELQIHVIWSNELGPETPPTASFKYRSIVMNENWYNQDELTFQLAHELAHILNGNAYDAALYKRTFSCHALIEHEANVGALELLLPYYCENINKKAANTVDFMTIFHIPSHLLEATARLIHRYYQGQASLPLLCK